MESVPEGRCLRLRRRTVVTVGLGVPFGCLLLSYLWLALEHHTLLLWNVIVHESGRYDLGATIFYHSHFLREIFVDIGMALFLLAGFAGVVGSAASRSVSDRRPRWWIVGGAVALVLTGWAFVTVTRRQGLDSSLLDLLQYRTRDDLVAYGSHWHVHLLGLVWFGAASLLLAGLLSRLRGVVPPRRNWRAAIAWAYLFGLTIVFGAPREVFLDVRYTGHAAREIMTHGPVTLLLGFGLLTLIRRPEVASGAEASMGEASKTWSMWVWLALTVLVPAYVTIVTLSGDWMGAGQSDLGLAAMVGAHFFEHVMDYLLVVSLVLAGSALDPPRAIRRLKVSALV